MNSRLHYDSIRTASILVYGLVLGLFVYSSLVFQKNHEKQELKYINTIETEITHILDQRQELVEERLSELRSNYALEIVVLDQDSVIYNSVPVADAMFASINPGALLIEAQGTHGEYSLWYAIYHMPYEIHMLPYLKRQGLLLSAAFVMLSLVLFLIRKGFQKPLREIEAQILKMREYDFSHDLKSDDRITEALKAFSHSLEDKILTVESVHAKQRTAIQHLEHKYENTQTMARALIHDLKTPIHQIRLECEFFMSQISKRDCSLGDLVEIIIAKADHTIMSINAILQEVTYFKKEVIEQFEVTQQIYSSLKEYQGDFKLKHLKTDLILDACIKVTLNRAAFKLLIQNAISNMTKYAKCWSLIIIEAIVEQGRLSLRFTNQSTPENIENIRKSNVIFNTVDSQSNQVSGNGLFLIRDLTEMLGGSYRNVIKEDGVSVIIDLPLEQTE